MMSAGVSSTCSEPRPGVQSTVQISPRQDLQGLKNDVAPGALVINRSGMFTGRSAADRLQFAAQENETSPIAGIGPHLAKNLEESGFLLSSDHVCEALDHQFVERGIASLYHGLPPFVDRLRPAVPNNSLEQR